MKSELAQAHPFLPSFWYKSSKDKAFGMDAISKLIYTQLGNLIVTSLLVMICNSNNYPSKGNNDHACTSFQSQEYFKVSTGNQQAAKNQGAKWL